MARIAGVELQDKAKVDYAITRIKGIGWSLSRGIVDSLKLANKRVSELTPEEASKLAGKVESYLIEGDLLRQVRSNVGRLRTIGSYRGVRHTRGLPTRGQRTRRNARTKRGKRKTVGAFKKEVLAKAASAQPKEAAK